MDEHRHDQRLRALKAGKIVFNHRSSVLDCTIRNLSAQGASLQVASTVGIPESFDLLIGSDPASRPCRVAWRSESRLGVAFQ